MLIDNLKQLGNLKLHYRILQFSFISLISIPKVNFVPVGNYLTNDKQFICIFKELKKKIIMLASIPVEMDYLLL